MIVIVAGAVIGWLLFLWTGGSEPSASLLGTSFSYQPPTPPANPLGAVAAAAKERGLNLGEADGNSQRLGYIDRTDVATYLGQWSAQRDGQDVTLSVELRSSGGKWRVHSWQEK